MMQRLLVLMAALCLTMSGLRARTAVDSTQTWEKTGWQASLLTCSPGSKVYEYYGHTALRLRNKEHGDWVFNYGSFSFDKPNFVWRFVKGETDYELSVVPYGYFETAYAQDGRGIYEQVLNLTAAEAARLEAALAQNLRPENATYRYNFFYDNCVTRAINRIEEAVDGSIVWPEVQEGKTLRGIVGEFSEVSPWNRFGQNILLGAEADLPADMRTQMFAPLYAEQYVAGAKIKASDGTMRPLAQPVHVVLKASAEGKETKTSPFTPMVAVCMMMVVTAVSCGIRKRKHIWQWSAFLMALQGGIGLVVAFLFLFSEHPTVGSNLLVISFNPLPLLYLPWYMKHASMERRDYAPLANAVLLSVTIALGIFGVQQMPTEIMLFMLVSLLTMLNELRFKLKRVSTN